MLNSNKSYEKEFIEQIVYDENIVFSIAATKGDDYFLSMKYGSYLPPGTVNKKGCFQRHKI